jgi:hypothetical protein
VTRFPTSTLVHFRRFFSPFFFSGAGPPKIFRSPPPQPSLHAPSYSILSSIYETQIAIPLYLLSECNMILYDPPSRSSQPGYIYLTIYESVSVRVYVHACVRVV